MQGYREIGVERLGEFVARGSAQRHFFAHRTYWVPKAGPDGLQLARRMLGRGAPSQLSEILLYATGPQLDEFPPELFFDDDLVWHQQQFGLPGHVGSASLVLEEDRLYVTTFVSDIVQRIGRRREFKTRIEKLFHGWPHMLWNSILSRASELGVRFVHAATASLAIRHTDAKRVPQPAIYRRIYDDPPVRFGAVREGDWWTVDVFRALPQVVAPRRGTNTAADGRTICVFHDTEYGHGHTDVDPEFARCANEAGAARVESMLAAENEMGLTATYNVVGLLMPELREKIEKGGHCVAFHSHDHSAGLDQLARCRKINYRLKGYRPPQSRLTPELTDDNLSYRNFEWMASSARSFGYFDPRMENGIVKIPVLLDDFALYKEGARYEDWESQALQRIERQPFAAVGLHDCYAGFWLPHFPGFVEKLRRLGTLKTLNEVAASVTLSYAE